MTHRTIIACLLAALCACSGDDDTRGAGASGGSGGSSGAGGSGGSRTDDGSRGDASTTTAGHTTADAGTARDGGALCGDTGGPCSVRDAGAQGATIDCGADAGPNPIDDPSSFAGMHVAAILYDCAQVESCNRQRDLNTQSNFLTACACQSASLLADAQRQSSFLTKHMRCQLFVACDYTACVTTSASQ